MSEMNQNFSIWSKFSVKFSLPEDNKMECKRPTFNPIFAHPYVIEKKIVFGQKKIISRRNLVTVHLGRRKQGCQV